MTGAGGRPPSVLLQKMRGALEERLPILIAIADGEIDGEKVKVADQLRAIDLMAKYGLGTVHDLKVEKEDPEVRRSGEEIAQSLLALPPEVIAASPQRYQDATDTLRQLNEPIPDAPFEVCD